MPSLGSREKRFLLEVARRALTAAVTPLEATDLTAEVEADSSGSPARLDSIDSPELIDSIQSFHAIEFGGTFVTLHRRGRLRGCIGQLDSHQTLADAVAHSAKGAALEDPRFAPVAPHELPEIDIEISVLSLFRDISLDNIEPGTHGLLVTRGSQRGLLLPQVASQFHWPAQKFLEETCVKAGLDRNAWKDPATKIEGFTADVFSEEEVFARQAAGPARPTA
jgi:AmmeMemoRadiSam system protein A